MGRNELKVVYVSADDAFTLIPSTCRISIVPKNVFVLFTFGIFPSLLNNFFFRHFDWVCAVMLIWHFFEKFIHLNKCLQLR